MFAVRLPKHMLCEFQYRDRGHAHSDTRSWFDLYRLEKPEEAAELGLDEALDEGAAVIEWPEKLGHHLPANRLDVELAIQGERRRARLSPHGAWEGRALEF